MQNDPHWRDYVLFYEYFHGDNGAGIGAGRQTGWTALVAKLLQQCAEYCGEHADPLQGSKLPRLPLPPEPADERRALSEARAQAFSPRTH